MATHQHQANRISDIWVSNRRYWLVKCDCGQVAEPADWKRRLTEGQFVVEWNAVKPWRNSNLEEQEAFDLFEL